MSSFTISSAYKVGLKELRSGDLMVTFQVDKSNASQVLPFLLLQGDDPLTLTVSDAEVADGVLVGKHDLPSHNAMPVPGSDKAERNKKYGRIEILSKECGYNEEGRRNLQKNLTGHDSRTTMSNQDLDDVIKHLEKEANGIDALGEE